jgi:hypothetical protein
MQAGAQSGGKTHSAPGRAEEAAKESAKLDPSAEAIQNYS